MYKPTIYSTQMEHSLTEIMRSIGSYYSELSSECERDLIACCKLTTADKHTVLVKEGQYADKTYFIAKGAARAYYLKDGRDITDWFAFENAFISSINSFFLNIPSPYFIERLEPSAIVEISRAAMLDLCDKHHSFDRLCRIIVTKTMLQLQERVVSMQFESAQQKLDNLLVIRPDITNRVPLGHIATYMGITLETLSRIRHPKKRI